MSKSESDAPIRLPSAAQVKALLKEGARVKEKVGEIAGTYGDRVKSAVENGNLHAAAFGKAKSIYNKSRTNELAALEQMHHLRVYLDWIEEDIRNKGHVGDLDRMSKAAEAKQEPQTAASAAAEAFAKEDAATEANRTEARKALDLDGEWDGAAPPAPPAEAAAEPVADKPKRGGRKLKVVETAAEPAPAPEAAPPPPPPALKDDDEDEPSPTPRRVRAVGTATAIH